MKTYWVLYIYIYMLFAPVLFVPYVEMPVNAGGGAFY